MNDKVEALIDGIIQREKGYRNVSHDPGGRTNDGISENAHPEAWKDGVVTDEEKRTIYYEKYIKGPKFDQIPASHPTVQTLLIDWGVNSGPMIAVAYLQRTLGGEDDGRLGPHTLAAIPIQDDRTLTNQLVAARIKMIGRLIQRRPQQLPDLSGLLNRALGWVK